MPSDRQAVDQREQLIGLVLGKAGRWLVHDEDPGVLRQRFRDLGELPVGGTQAVHGGVGSIGEPMLAKISGRLLGPPRGR